MKSKIYRAIKKVYGRRRIGSHGYIAQKNHNTFIFMYDIKYENSINVAPGSGSWAVMKARTNVGSIFLSETFNKLETIVKEFKEEGWSLSEPEWYKTDDSGSRSNIYIERKNNKATEIIFIDVVPKSDYC